MKNLRLFSIFFYLVTLSYIGLAQTDEVVKETPWYQKGTISGKIFANFHTSGSDIGKENGFEVNRAYFGYDLDLDQHFSTALKLDIGNPTDFSTGGSTTVATRRFAFFKNAYLQYKYKNLKVQFGIADAFQFKVQERAWGYRYIASSFQDMYKFGSSADIGVFVVYKFNEWITSDYSLINGEGYGSVQADNNLKNTLGFTINPIKQLTLRVYGDIYSFSDSSQTTLAVFSGLKFDKFSVGGEYTYQRNHLLEEGANYSGFSLYGYYKLFSKVNLLGRFDHVESVTIEGEVDPWNIKKDGEFIIGGIEYIPMKNVNLALDYQYKFGATNEISDVASIYFNIQVTF